MTEPREYIVPLSDDEAFYGFKDVAAPLIRCKDCKHSEPWYRDRRRCFLWDEGGVSVWDDGFCNYAERD